MDTITIKGEPRGTGTRSARAVRREGNVPCVLYGQHDEPVAFQVHELVLHPLIYTDETHVVSVTVDGKSYDCVMKEIEFHPVTDRPFHADFQVLTAGEAITLTVPVQYHGTPAGQIEGGDTQVILHEMQVRCLPKDIPSHIDVEISHLNIGDAIHVGDLDAGKLEFLAPEQQTMVTVVAPKLTAADIDDEAAIAALQEDAADERAEESSDDESEA